MENLDRDGFYMAEGVDSLISAAEYNIPLSDISKRYNISESILRKSTVGDVANKYGVSVSSALNELRSMAQKRKNWLEQLTDGLSGINNINTPVNPPPQNAIPQKEANTFKIWNEWLRSNSNGSTSYGNYYCTRNKTF
mgnify:CR=1 FL=1